MLFKFLCRIGRHPGVIIRDCTVYCAVCGKVVDRIDCDSPFNVNIGGHD